MGSRSSREGSHQFHASWYVSVRVEILKCENGRVSSHTRMPGSSPVKVVVSLVRFFRTRNAVIHKWVSWDVIVGDIWVIYGFGGKCQVFVRRRDLKTGRVKKMHEAIYLINPIIELQIVLWIVIFISQLLRASWETVGSVLCTWNMDESEVKEKDRDNPAIGTISGFISIPLIYHTLTSTIKFWTPIKYIFSERRAWKRP